MKRSFLVLLAAAFLNVGVVGSPPAQAATPDSYAPTVVTPQHHRRHDGWWHDGHRRHHHHDGWDDDGWDHDGRHHRCDGLVVVCLLDR